MPPSIFNCRCGWLLYSPTTLPCGHTFCRDCVEEEMICKFCDITVAKPCSPSRLLIDLISAWFQKEYKLCSIKKESKELLKDGKYDKALEVINMVIQESPSDFTALNIRSEIRSKLGQQEDALKDAELSCEVNYNCGKSHFRRGICYSDMGKLNDAIDAFQVCLEVEPEDVELSNQVISSIDKILSEPADPFDVKDAGDDTSDSEKSSGDESPSSKQPIKEIISDSSCSENEYSGNEKKSTNDKAKDVSNSSCDFIVQEKEILKKHDVPVNLIRDEDVECKLCFELLFQPVTTACGHVFCKRCLLRTLDHNSVCPICRFSLTDCLSSPIKQTVIIEEILTRYYEEQYGDRKSDYDGRMKELSRVGTDEDVEIPIFLCSVVFPYVQCPLHIFEPKYRLMIRDCLESGSKKFGICVQTSGEISDIGTICEIKKWQILPDGRFIIHTVAGQRFLVRDKSSKESLTYANVTFYLDEYEDLGSEQLSNLSKLIYNQLLRYINSLTKAEQDCIFNALGIIPNYTEDHDKYKHGVPWVWWGLAAVPLNLTAKLVLLRCKCVSERMLSLQRFLRFLTRLQPKSDEGTSGWMDGTNGFTSLRT